MEYDKENRLCQIHVQKADGTVCTYTYIYDELGRIKETKDEEGNISKLSYDANGNIAQVTDAVGNVVQDNQYNSRNQISSFTDGMGAVTQYTYHTTGDIKEVVQYLNTASEQKTTYEYDSSGRIKEVTDAEEGVSSCTYNALGYVESVTNPEGGITAYEYNYMGKVTAERLKIGDTVSSRRTYSYDAVGSLTRMNNANTQETQYEYDAAGRVSTITDELGTIAYTYDKNGNVLTVMETQGTVQRSIERKYDALNRVTEYTDFNGNTIKYSYDELGNVISLTYPGGRIVRYSYYKNGNLKTVTDWDNRVTSYVYDGNGRITQVTRPDGSEEQYGYDVNGRLRSQKDTCGDTVIHTYEYAYDKAGNVTSVTGFQEDGALKLSEVTMEYDTVNRLISYNGEAVTYDKEGNMLYGPLEGQMVAFTYDCRNRLVQAGNTTYEYDAENNRIAVATGEKRQEFVVDTVEPLSRMLLSTTYDKAGAEGKSTYFIYGNGLLAQTEEEKGYLTYHYNNIGSTTELTNDKGAVVSRYSYGPYGELLSGEQNDILFLYNGKAGVVTDANSLYYMRARYYNVDSKRFINQDVLTGSVGDSPSQNRYAYVQGNPITLTDPFGLSPEFSWSSFGHAVLNALGFIPGIGDVCDVINGLWYLAEGEVALGLSCFVSALPGVGSFIGNGARLCFQGSKILKAASMIEKGCGLVSNAVTLARSAYNATDTVSSMYDKYVVNGESAGWSTLGEVATLGLDVFSGVMAGKGLSKNLKGWKRANDAGIDVVSKTAPEGKIEVTSIGLEEQLESGRVLEYNLQFFASKGGSKSGNRPPNLSPKGARRNGAFREAKRNSNIPVSKQPKNVTPAVDKKGKRMPGKDYDFGDGKVIRDHSGGHEFPDDPSQNRGPHFNDPDGNHYDY
ncbi:RHS repeat-associated core domain-containing protein [Anaeromicropila populeti]|uniref:RHS repeat-associated core domain-containing protein n=1 Tax=Anaeromicropila populeti TaxID=37658 RepID=A0A1I6I597_9FIRM|nr:RHS repeat-associated core domain-containing protein [Anaeromicropila populeti]SFR61808.1 RHS repeat-associated core domain-containing protein [Anaeromicropila populeti]